MILDDYNKLNGWKPLLRLGVTPLGYRRLSRRFGVPGSIYLIL
jgi:hypothetical protein